MPGWATIDRFSADVPEPFRSDPGFWSSVAASADALLLTIPAIGLGVLLVFTAGPAWSPLPFLAPAAMLVRAGVRGRDSARRSQQRFANRREWRDAERGAVAAVFVRVMRRPRLAGRS